MGKDKYIKIDGRIIKVPGETRDYNGLADYIIKEEGFLSKPTDIGDGKMTLGSGLTDPKWRELYRKRGNKWSEEDNKRAVIEEIKLREKILSDTFPNWEKLPEESQNALISYKYNYNFTPANSPKLYQAARDFNYRSIAAQMDATSKDPKFKKGLMERRKREQEMFLSGFPLMRKVINNPIPVEQPDALRVTTPYTIQQQNTILAPVMVPDEDNYITTHTQTEPEYRAEKLRNNFEAFQNYNRLMNAISIQNNPTPQYVPQNAPYVIDSYSQGGELKSKPKWDELSMAEKAEMIKVAVKNGITNMPDIRKKYNEYAEGGSKEEVVNTDEQYLNTMEKVAEENYKNWGYNNSDEALVHALNDNTYDYRGYYNKYPQSRANADTHWTDEFKTVYHPTFSNESIYSGQKSQYNPLGLPGGFWVGEDENASFIPMTWQTINNQYKSGGGIHIKHPGRLTALKKRTGKTEAELYNDGNPAHKKMVVFARNSRKWHADGGNLFEEAGQMQVGLNVPRIGLDVQGWPNYTTEQIVAYGKENERRRKAIQDAYLNFVTEFNDATAVANGRPQNKHLKERVIKGAKAHRAWEKEHSNLTAWGNILGAVPFAVAAAPAGAWGLAGISALGDAAAATSVGQGITNFLTPIATTSYAGATAPQWFDLGLTSGFGAHGVQTAIDERGVSPMTALEVAPLGRLTKPMFNETAMAIENYKYPLGRPQVPENFLTIKPQVRTRVGDVEIDNPNLLYHLDRGDGAGAFSTQGAYVEDGFLFPGTPKDASATAYSWWNKGKPYATHVGEQPLTRLMTTTEDAPGMLHVRSQNYPIGQWNGQRGFVLNSEYVNPEGVDVSQSLFNWEPEYGFRKVNTVPTAGWLESQEVPTNITERFFKWLGRPLNSVKRETLPSEYADRLTNMTLDDRSELMAQEKMLKDAGIDMSKIDAGYIMEAFDKRTGLLANNPPTRYTIVKPVGPNGYELYDNVVEPDGIRTVGKTQIYGESDNNLHMGYIENLSRFDENKVGGVQARGLNSAINVAKSIGRNGIVTGEQYQNAPLQLHVLDKFTDRIPLYGRGNYSNVKAVEDYRRAHKIPRSFFEDERYVDTVEEMRNASPDVNTYLNDPNTPAFLLKEPIELVPTKSTIFDPRRIDASGKLLIDWNDYFVFNRGGHLNKRRK